jgi:hypothetical protein
MLNLVPFTGAGREMAGGDRDPDHVRKLLQLDLPQPRAMAVGATAVGGDPQPAGVREPLSTQLPPPRKDARDRELGRVVGDPDRHEPLVMLEVIDAVRRDLSQLLVLEIMRADPGRSVGETEFDCDRPAPSRNQLVLVGSESTDLAGFSVRSIR